MPPKAQHAIVIGASMAGLVAARVLADHFDRVTLIEKDAAALAPGYRDGVPQGRHVHNLLSRGDTVLDQLFPGLYQQLDAAGAQRVDWSRDVRWHHHGVWKVRCDSGITSWFMSRPLLESCVRDLTLARGGVTLACPAEVTGFLWSADGARVQGVRLADGREGRADLIVECSGRNGAAEDNLTEAGFPAPPRMSITSDVVYATREMRPREDPGFLAIAQVAPPPQKRSAVAFAIEDGRWMTTLFGYHGDHPPRDAEGWMDFAASLEQPDFHRLVSTSTPLSEVRRYHFRSSQWRRFDRMARRPAGLIHMGDVVCSFNPIYGQGMTSATLQAAALAELLKTEPLDRLHDLLPRRAARVINDCWQAVAAEDFRHAETTGDAMPMASLVNWYTRRVHRLASVDATIETAFLRVMHMERGFASLFHPRILAPALLRPV